MQSRLHACALARGPSGSGGRNTAFTWREETPEQYTPTEPTGGPSCRRSLTPRVKIVFPERPKTPQRRRVLTVLIWSAIAFRRDRMAGFRGAKPVDLTWSLLSTALAVSLLSTTAGLVF
jgi:hypothetical protein